MSPDLTTLQPYALGQACADGMYDEPDHTNVPQGFAYDFSFEPIAARYLWWGMIDRMYGPAALNAHCN